MKVLSLPSGDYLAVVVPVGVKRFFIVRRHRQEVDLVYKRSDGWAGFIPIANWQKEYECLGRFRDITEETAKGIVPKGYFGRKFCGWQSFVTSRVYYATALESLASLLRSHDLEPDEIVLLKIKK